MNELIKVNFNNDKQTVSARELHEKLGIRERFSAWFERCQKTLNLVEGNDYCRTTYTNNNNQEFNDYVLPIDIAKHICMLSGGENAYAIRQYFIEIEKAWNSPEAVMARALKMADCKISTLQNEVKALQPKAVEFDKFMSAENLQTMNEVAKCLNIGRNNLFSLLRAKKILMANNQPYQSHIQAKHFEVKEKPISMGDKSINYVQTFVTPLGMTYISNLLKKEACR